MMSALPPGPGPLAWQCGQSNTFQSATTRAFMLLFPDLFGLKHVELNIPPAPCSCTCIAPEIDLWELAATFATRHSGSVSMLSSRKAHVGPVRRLYSHVHIAEIQFAFVPCSAACNQRAIRKGGRKGSLNRKWRLVRGSDFSLLTVWNLLSCLVPHKKPWQQRQTLAELGVCTQGCWKRQSVWQAFFAHCHARLAGTGRAALTGRSFLCALQGSWSASAKC